LCHQKKTEKRQKISGQGVDYLACLGIYIDRNDHVRQEVTKYSKVVCYQVTDNKLLVFCLMSPYQKHSFTQNSTVYSIPFPYPVLFFVITFITTWHGVSLLSVSLCLKVNLAATDYLSPLLYSWIMDQCLVKSSQ
jgi:hypothetical protein